MSGRKSVTINSYTLDSLRQQAARATTLEASNRAIQAMNTLLTNALNQADIRINALNQDLSDMNQRLAQQQESSQQAVENLHEQLFWAVRSSNERLAAQAEAHKEEMQTLREEFGSNLSQLRTDLEEQDRILNSRVNAANNRIDQINDALAQTQGDQALLQSMAQEFLDMANQLNTDSQRYRCELLLPGQLAGVLQAASNAEAQCSLRGNASAAQLDARNAYLDALAFHERIVEAEQEWTRRYQAAMVSVAQAQARIENSREVTHEATGVRLDVNHWSDGDWQTLHNDAAALHRHLQTDAQNDSLQDLENIRAAGQQLQQETVDTVAFTLGAAQSSQWRASIAAILGRNLLDRDGLRLDGWGYQGSDARGAHRMRLVNASGFEMVITQTPEMGADGQLRNRLETDIIHPGTFNEETARALAEEIQTVLGENGIQTGALTTVPGCEALGSGRKETADLSRWRTEQAVCIRPVHRQHTETAQKQR